MLTFANSLLLAGAALISVPILIHLLNRMRYKVVEWAAMEFLFQAYKEERRRVQLEHWVLLAMRCLIVALLVLAVADPAIRYAGLGGIGAQPTERIVLLDDTYSMGHGPTGEAAFTRARVEIERLIDSLADGRSRDSITLVVASRPAEPIFEEMALSDKNLAVFKERLRALEPSDRARPAREYLADFHDSVLARREGAGRVVYYFSDFRQVDWKAEDWAGVSNPGSVPGLAPDTRWVLADVGEDEPANLSISAVETRPREVVAGIEFELLVKVENRGDRPAQDVVVSIRVGEELQRDAKIDEIDRGSAAHARFPLTLSSAGEYPIVVTIPPDPLAADNVHYARAVVLEDHPILLVDGDPPGYDWARETYFLARALAPRGPQRSGLAPRILGDEQFRDVKNLDDFSIVYLCNLPPLGASRVAELEGYVARGGSVVFYLGDQVVADDYNRSYFRNGEGLLPYKLEAARDLVSASGRDAPGATFDPDVDSHPVLRAFAGGLSTFLTDVVVRRAFDMEVAGDPPAGSSVVCRYDDPDRTVAIAEKAFGKGRVFVITTTADLGSLSLDQPGWNDWLKSPGYLIFHQELADYLLALRPLEPARRPGAVVRFPIDTSRFDRIVRFTPHAESESAASYEEPARENRRGEAQGLWVEYDKTEEVGLFRFDLTAKSGQLAVSRYVPITLDPRDGELEKAGQVAVRQRVEEAARAAGFETPELGYYEIFREAGSANWLQFLEEKTRIWQWVLVGLMVLLLTESVYAWWIGNR